MVDGRDEFGRWVSQLATTKTQVAWPRSHAGWGAVRRPFHQPQRGGRAQRGSTAGDKGS